ncbi:MAG: hypothetical protein RQ745_14010 [Longimicrobiales bacterium]|nr:hypothetical protein [Longimicrobiales bacterium]
MSRSYRGAVPRVSPFFAGHSLIVLASLLLVLVAGGCAEQAATTDELPTRVATDLVRGAECATCLTLDSVAMLGDAADEISIEPTAMTIPCGLGWTAELGFISARMVGEGVIGVYGSGGALDSLVGRPGSGPGEFRGDMRVLTTDAAMHVVDNRNLRVAHLGTGGEWMGSTRFPARAVAHTVLGSGQLLLHARPRGGEEAEPPYRLFVDADDVHRFGAVDPELGELDQRVVTGLADSSSEFIEAGIWRYELTRRNVDGSVRWRLARRPEWFSAPPPSLDDVGRMHVEIPPAPVVTQVWEDDAGHLRVLSMVPDLDWSPGTPDSRSIAWIHDTFDSVLEVIDPETRELLGSRRSDEVLAAMCGSRWLYTIRETEEGDTRAVVLRAELASPPVEVGEGG